ncbi:MAG: LemA family protein [Sandarakinorhabdus sp.]|nr:LemA family protein [Sandarakinorhabdus sp.]
MGLIIAGVVLAMLYFWYAGIVAKRNRVAEALAGIDAQLNMRHDLVPNLLAIAKRYMAHEADVIEAVTKLRAAATGASDPAAKFAAEAKLDAGIGRLMADAENYPALKADGPMIEAQRGLQEVETNIAAARRFYNSAVADLRNATQTFPGSLIAPLAGAGGAPPPFFEAPAEARAPIDAAALL